MALETMKVTFGGLCMLVQRTKPADKSGLYVLMPRVAHHHAHCPIIVCGAPYSPDGASVLVEHLSASDKINLSGLAAGSRQVIKYVGDVSAFDGDRKVDVNCLDGVHDALAARVILPLAEGQSAIKPMGAAAKFKVPTAAGYRAKPLYGLMTISYEIANPTAWDLTIKGKKLRLDSKNHLEFSILNVRPKDALGTKPYIHRKNYPWTHQQAYFSLLKESLGPFGPPALINENGGSEQDLDDVTICSDIRFDVWPPFKAAFIDPYTCTLGGGCPPGESC